MTSIADGGPSSPRRSGAWLRAGLLLALLVALALQGPMPWGGLWLLVPAAVGASMLAAWRFGAWGALVPVALFAATVALQGPYGLWAWWVPVAALTGAWMGLREEGGGPTPGERAWMLLPVLLLAAALPWMFDYGALVGRVDARLREGDRQWLDAMRTIAVDAGRVAEMERMVEEATPVRSRLLPQTLPTIFFVWMVLLVGAGRALSGRFSAIARWPEPSRGRLRDWRLPDGAIWLFIAGLTLLVLEWKSWSPTAWTLLLNAGLGFCVQGIAVVESLLLARGVPAPIILLTMLFAFTIAMPVFMLTTVALGLSDVWLDYRRLEASPDGESPSS